MNKRSLLVLALAWLLGCGPSAATVDPVDGDGDGDVVGLEVAVNDVPATATDQPGLGREFADTAAACEALVPSLVEREDLRAPILDWCLERAYRSSRHGKARSRLDGSWIHDRDRPSAKAFYLQGLRAGYLDPDSCEHHVVDKTIRRSREAREFPGRWPYGTHCDLAQGECRPSAPGNMLASVAEAWLDNAPDYERFGTRGPIDNNLWVATKYLGGCFPPEELDRHDVAAAVTIERAEDLCLRLEARLDTRGERQAAKARALPTSCRSMRDIRAIWHPQFWYRELREALG